MLTTYLYFFMTSSSDGQRLAAAIGNGFICTSSNAGVNWTDQTGSGSRNWTSITSSSDGQRLAAAVGNGFIYTSSNAGVNWTEQTNAGSRNWTSITSSSNGDRLAAVAPTSSVWTGVINYSGFYNINSIVANPQPGTIIAYLGTSFPDGWMICDGQTVNRNSFPNLASALGQSTFLFSLPNLQGLFLRGIGTYDTNHSGPSIRSVQQDIFQKHFHNFNYTSSTPSGSGGTGYNASTGTSSSTISSTGSTETRPYCYGVNWIIKTDLIVNVPGQPTIIGVVGTSATGINVSFSAPLFNSDVVTNYEYSIDRGLNWITRFPSSTASPISISSGTYTSVRLRAVNINGPGQASSLFPVS